MILNGAVILLDEFLPAEAWRELLDYSVAQLMQAPDQRPGTQHGGNPAPCRILPHPGPFATAFDGQLQSQIPRLLSGLGFTTQLAAVLNNEYLALDGPLRAPGVVGRFVYFLYREPRSFCGGEVRVRDWKNREHIIYPGQNQLAMFSSEMACDCVPLGMASPDPRDALFVMSGWLQRAPTRIPAPGN